jgi:hydrogenase nickel incorporation protein HypA/HybF
MSTRALTTLQSILQKAILQARASHARHVKALQLALGEIADLDQISIQEHWQDLSRGTPAEQAQLRFRLIPAEVQCMACFQKYRPQNGTINCPYCGSYGAKILAGEEFYLESIELDNE